MTLGCFSSIPISQHDLDPIEGMQNRAAPQNTAAVKQRLVHQPFSTSQHQICG